MESEHLSPTPEQEATPPSWEALHQDPATGFVARVSTICFSEAGRDSIAGRYCTLAANACPDARLYIAERHFRLVGWCIARVVGERFDPRRGYRFSRPDWLRILDEALHLLGLTGFGRYHAQLLRGLPGSERDALTTYAPAIWDDRERVRAEIADIRTWSELVLRFGGEMEIW